MVHEDAAVIGRLLRKHGVVPVYGAADPEKGSLMFFARKSKEHVLGAALGEAIRRGDTMKHLFYRAPVTEKGFYFIIGAGGETGKQKLRAILQTLTPEPESKKIPSENLSKARSFGKSIAASGARFLKWEEHEAPFEKTLPKIAIVKLALKAVPTTRHDLSEHLSQTGMAPELPFEIIEKEDHALLKFKPVTKKARAHLHHVLAELPGPEKA